MIINATDVWMDKAIIGAFNNKTLNQTHTNNSSPIYARSGSTLFALNTGISIKHDNIRKQRDNIS